MPSSACNSNMLTLQTLSGAQLLSTQPPFTTSDPFSTPLDQISLTLFPSLLSTDDALTFAHSLAHSVPPPGSKFHPPSPLTYLARPALVSSLALHLTPSAGASSSSKIAPKLFPITLSSNTTCPPGLPFSCNTIANLSSDPIYLLGPPYLIVPFATCITHPPTTPLMLVPSSSLANLPTNQFRFALPPHLAPILTLSLPNATLTHPPYHPPLVTTAPLHAHRDDLIQPATNPPHRRPSLPTLLSPLALIHPPCPSLPPVANAYGSFLTYAPTLPSDAPSTIPRSPRQKAPPASLPLCIRLLLPNTAPTEANFPTLPTTTNATSSNSAHSHLCNASIQHFAYCSFTLLIYNLPSSVLRTPSLHSSNYHLMPTEST